MINENLDVFTSGEFGQLCLIDGVEIWGIFDENYDTFFAENPLNSDGKNITLLVQTNRVGVSDRSPVLDEARIVAHGNEVRVGDRLFSVVSIQPIDDGKFSNLILKELT